MPPECARASISVAMALQPARCRRMRTCAWRAPSIALHALPEARREVLAALEIAPNFEPAQQLLLQVLGAAGPAQPSGPAGAAPHSHPDKGSL